MLKKKRHNIKTWFQSPLFVAILVAVLLCILAIILYCLMIAPHSGAEDFDRDYLLPFWSAYLSFAAAVFIGAISISQTFFLNRKEQERRQDDRDWETMPRLAVRIADKNSWVRGMERPDDVMFAITEGLKHSNITFEIRNVGLYATTNIYLESDCIASSLLPGESVQVAAAPTDSEDWERYPGIFVGLDSDSSGDGYACNIMLMSNDVSGRLVSHRYRLINQDGKEYYAYEEGSPEYEVW